MKKKETRGRPFAQIDPVDKEDGDWVRLITAVQRTGFHADTIRSLSKYNKIRKKTTGGVNFYFIKKDD